LQREVARFWQPLRILGGSQHCRQIPFQLDLEFALVRPQNDGVDEATQRLRGFRSGLWLLQGLCECGDLWRYIPAISVQQRRGASAAARVAFNTSRLAAFAFSSSFTSEGATPFITISISFLRLTSMRYSDRQSIVNLNG
jgi:hypothetical protein